MNLYNLHDKPESLYKHDKADTEIPEIFWDRYKDNPAELKKREAGIANSSKYSHMYARDVIKGPWPPGERAIDNKRSIKKLYDRFLATIARSKDKQK